MGFDGCLTIGYTIFRSAFLCTPVGSKYQINDDSYINCINHSPNAIGNVLIIPGGGGMMDSYPYYIKLTRQYLMKQVRLFVFEKRVPVANIAVIHDIQDAARFIREHFGGPIVLVGYSVGGIVLYAYLAFGYDAFDLYIPVCCSVDTLRFEQSILNNAVFKNVITDACKSFKVNNLRELIALGGCIVTHDKYLVMLVRRLNDKNWTHKVYYILSSDDPLTHPPHECCACLKNKPHTHIVRGGWHCCMKTICLTATVANKYICARDDGIILSPECLDP